MIPHISRAEVDLDAIAHNVRRLVQHIGPRTELMAVVKANAYGHGKVPVAGIALANGATRLGIGRVEEGCRLRQSGISAPILLMCYSSPSQAGAIVQHSLTPTVNALELAEALSAQVQAQDAPPLPVHLKVDTGMGRFGVMPEEAVDFARALSRQPGLQLEGFYSHYCTADEADTSHTERQFAIFTELLRQLEEEGIQVPCLHVCNSAATLRFPKMQLDLVRCGIAMYGLRPSPDTPLPFPLHPAMALKTQVGRVRTLPADWGISYGRTCVTCEPTPVALVPLGYGDGYHRRSSNRGAVLIHGQRAPIVGRVCMDQFVVDITGIEGVAEGDEVVLFGSQGDAHILADEVAEWTETINYEVVTSILPRVPRIYLRDGETTSVQLTTQSA